MLRTFTEAQVTAANNAKSSFVALNVSNKKKDTTQMGDALLFITHTGDLLLCVCMCVCVCVCMH